MSLEENYSEEGLPLEESREGSLFLKRPLELAQRISNLLQDVDNFLKTDSTYLNLKNLEDLVVCVKKLDLFEFQLQYFQKRLNELTEEEPLGLIMGLSFLKIALDNLGRNISKELIERIRTYYFLKVVSSPDKTSEVLAKKMLYFNALKKEVLSSVSHEKAKKILLTTLENINREIYNSLFPPENTAESVDRKKIL